ncbi:MAG: D-2-hydroxyacid dehydrogenase [Anaerolineaceae bacterium]
MNSKSLEILITLPFTSLQLDRIRTASKQIKVVQYKTNQADVIPPEVWAKANILYTDSVLPTPTQAPRIDWIQFHTTGIDSVKNDPFLEKAGLKITTLSGASAPQMAEFALTLMLALSHKLPELSAYQSRGEWPKDRWGKFKPAELRGATVVLVGYGSINRELARLLQPFQATILAAKRDAMHPQDNDYSLPSLGDPDGELFQRLYPSQALKSMLKECDFIVVAVPLTEKTRHLIGASELAACKPTAFLVDISRGGVVNSESLVQALKDNRLGGAALDVFSSEPLHPADPLWKAPRTIITPHIGGFSSKYDERAMDLFVENIENYLNDRPLFNQFNFHRGY